MEKYANLVEVAKQFSKEENRGITFIHDTDEEDFVSYSSLYKLSLNCLYALQEKGIKQGEEILFQINDNKTFVILFWACILGGIVPVPVAVASNESGAVKVCNIWEKLEKPRLITEQVSLEFLNKYLGKSEAYMTICEEIQNNILYVSEFVTGHGEGVICAPTPEQTAFIQFSSGSTGSPKGVVLSHENVTVNIHSLTDVYEITSEDSVLSWMPLTHDMGLIVVHLAVTSANINQFIMPTKLFIQKPVLWLQKASEHKITGLYSPNFGYAYFLQFYQPDKEYQWDLSNVRYIANGAEPISMELCSRFAKKLKKYQFSEDIIKAVYGLAEATVGVCATPINEKIRTFCIKRKKLNIGEQVELVKPSESGSVIYADVGYPVKDCYVRVCDESNQPLEDLYVGFIEVFGKNVMKEYYHDPEETACVMTDDHWLKTGDIGFMSKGRLTVIGRSKEMILVHGQNYYPHDIEQVAIQVEGIELWNVAACGIYNHATSEDEVILFVIYKRKLELFAPLAIKIERQIRKKIGINVKHVIPIKKIPKTTSGKIQRFILQSAYEKGEYSDIIEKLSILKKQHMDSDIVEQPLTHTQRKLLAICREELDNEYIGIQDNLYELGGDSIRLSKIYTRINELYPGRIAEKDLFSYWSVEKLAEFLDSGKEVQPMKEKKKSFEDELNQLFDNVDKGSMSLEDAEKYLDKLEGR